MNTSEIAKERLQSNNKNNKKRKILLATLLPISIGIMALSFGLGFGLGCKPANTFVEKDIPNTDKFYSYAADGSVLGWSDKVIDNPHILDEYDTMNLHGKTINGACRFTLKTDTDTSDTIGVFKEWEAYKKIDLSNTNWEYENAADTTKRSGYKTFACADLSHCIDLNLHGAKFAALPAATVAVRTAFLTFDRADLSGLSSLNLSGAVFAVGNMTTGDDSAFTAFQTFYSANLSGLTSLNLNSAVFAAGNMITAGTGGVYTAAQTFSRVKLSKLSSLNLSSLKLGNAGDNVINSTCFLDIVKNADWSTTKLQIGDTDDYWKTPSSAQIAQLNTWFGTDKWQ